MKILDGREEGAGEERVKRGTLLSDMNTDIHTIS